MHISQKLIDASGLISYLYELEPKCVLSREILPRKCYEIAESIERGSFPKFDFVLEDIESIYKDLFYLQVSDDTINLFTREIFRKKLIKFKYEFTDAVQKLDLIKSDILLLADIPFLTDEYLNDKYTSPFIKSSLASGSFDHIQSKSVNFCYTSNQLTTMSKNIFLPDDWILRHVCAGYMDIYEVAKNPLLSEKTFEKMLTFFSKGKKYSTIRSLLCGLSCNRNIHYFSSAFIEKYGISPNPLTPFCKFYRFENKTLNELMEKLDKILN